MLTFDRINSEGIDHSVKLTFVNEEVTVKIKQIEYKYTQK